MQQRGGLLGVERPGDEESLAELAVQRPKRVDLVGVLDRLGDDVEAEIGSKAGDRAHESGLAPGLADAGDKGSDRSRGSRGAVGSSRRVRNGPRPFLVISQPDGLLAMQKVEGSIPFVRS